MLPPALRSIVSLPLADDRQTESYPLGRMTPYAWMWPLGSEWIVGKPEVMR